MSGDPWRLACPDCGKRHLLRRSYGHWCRHCKARVEAVDLRTGTPVDTPDSTHPKSHRP